MDKSDIAADMRNLEDGEFSRTALAATAELKAHPEREALAGVWHVIALLLVVALIVAVATTPVFVYWVWTRG